VLASYSAFSVVRIIRNRRLNFSFRTMTKHMYSTAFTGLILLEFDSDANINGGEEYARFGPFLDEAKSIFII